jgi:uroporphyrinogen decarboxylase
MNSKFQNALKRTPQNTPPVWFMRQAGRYHKHYQGLRQNYSFMELCKEPDLAAQVALGPMMDFDFDVSILFSDLLFPLEALGLGLEYTEAGPRLGRHLDTANINEILEVPLPAALEKMRFQNVAVRETRKLLPEHKSLIGFVGGPWTLFVYAVEGGHAGSLLKSKTQSSLYGLFAKKLKEFLRQNIQLQFEGGAEVVMIFDTAAGEVSPLFFQEYLQKDLIHLAEQFPGKIGYYSKGTQSAHFTKEFLNASWAGFGVDHRWDLAREFREGTPITQRGFVQGNFDQSLLHLEHQEFKREVDKYLAPFAQLKPEQRLGWVCGLGHGVLPKTPEENVRYFVQRVREVLK